MLHQQVARWPQLSWSNYGCWILGEGATGEVAVEFCWRTVFLLSSSEKKWWLLWATETQLIKILRTFVKAISTCHGIWHWVHMSYLEVFFQEGSALRPLCNCTLRDGDLQMLNMQIAALHSQLRQYWVQIRHQPPPLSHWEPTHWKSGPLSTRIAELFTIFTFHLRSCVEHKREKRRGKNRKKKALAGWNIKRLYPLGQASWSNAD